MAVGGHAWLLWGMHGYGGACVVAGGHACLLGGAWFLGGVCVVVGGRWHVWLLGCVHGCWRVHGC